MKMGWKRRGIIVAILCWYLYQPIPNGFSEPWKCRLILTPPKVILDICMLMDTLGFGLITNLFPLPPPSSDPRISVDVFDGVHVRLYDVRRDIGSLRPVFIYYHGGGWIFSGSQMYDRQMLALLDRTEVMIVSVDYRLANETIKYPVPLEDCLKATKYLLQNADIFGVDPNRVAIGGDSAGGNLAAAVALKLRDEQFQPQPKLQVLIYPVLQAIDFQLPSYVQNADGPLLLRKTMAWMWSWYAMGSSKYSDAMTKNIHTTPAIKDQFSRSHLRHNKLEDRYQYSPYIKPKLDFGDTQMWEELRAVLLDPYISPLLAEDLSGLPKAFVYTAEADVLRDEGLLYVNRLREAGNDVTHIHGDTAFHGIYGFDSFEEGRLAQQSVNDFITENI